MRVYMQLQQRVLGLTESLWPTCQVGFFWNRLAGFSLDVHTQGKGTVL